MISKLALKRLTKSDLTLFAWHFRNQPAGNQKAINLNANVFTGQLYPGLREHQGNIGIDMWIAGPAAAEQINLQRKIIKGARYKNWRLDGELIHNPEDASERFNILQPDDVALLGFEGEPIPARVTLVLVGQTAQQDKVLYRGLDGVLANKSMTVVMSDKLGELCDQWNVPQSHPVWLLTRNEDLVEAAMGQAPAVTRLLNRTQTKNMSLDDLRKARRAAEDMGRLGEELVDYHLNTIFEAGRIVKYEWTSNLNAIAPYDFRVERTGAWQKLEIKTTAGDFKREFYLSFGELCEMASGEEEYVIGRVYQASPKGAKLRISQELQAYGRSILDVFTSLPEGVTSNGVTVRPDDLMFGEEISLIMPNGQGSKG